MQNREGWRSAELDPAEAGASGLVRAIEDYALGTLGNADISHVESYDPIYSAERAEMTVHAVSDAMVMSVTKVRQGEFRDNYGERLELAEHFASHPFNPTEAWGRFEESVTIPTRFHFTNESCNDFPVTIMAVMYDGYGNFAAMRRNPQ